MNEEKTVDVKRREGALLEMGKALRAISIYPPTHPQRANILGQAYGNIQAVLQTLGDLGFNVTRDGFLIAGEKLGIKHQMVRDLGYEMHLRQVRSFTLRKDLSLNDFTVFLEMLLEDPENFRGGRFIEKWFTGRNVKTVWVNEIDFTKMTTMAADAGEEEEDGAGADNSVESHLQDALDLLNQENDPGKFSQILRELEVVTRPLIDSSEYRTAWVVVKEISNHATEEMHGDSPGGRQVIAGCLGTVRGLTKGGFLTYLLKRYAEPGEQERIPLQRVFIQVGPPALDEAINIISSHEAMSAYKPLNDLIVDFAADARAVLEAKLVSDNSVILRKVLFLLGEMRLRKSVEAIRPLISYPDAKVRREAIRALAKIRGMESSRVLVSALQKEKDQDIKIVIVQALGESKDLAGVPTLINLLKKTPLTEETLRFKEEMLAALGQIGSKEALPPLIKILHKWSVFNKELTLELRVKTAEALGVLGGENAMQALARYAGRGDGELEITCTRVLEELLARDTNPGGA